MRRERRGEIRRRHEWRGWFPRWDRSLNMLWPQLTWMYWTWDYPPSDLATDITDTIDMLRKKRRREDA